MARGHDDERLYRKFLFRSRLVQNPEKCIETISEYLLGIGMIISAQWELVLGNTYGYTVLSAFGFFYGGFGAIITPLFGVTAAYGTDTVEYNNALGFFVLSMYHQKGKHSSFISDFSQCGRYGTFSF